jgi:predicted TIM-barrel fold metal-dependent hydrolase
MEKRSKARIDASRRGFLAGAAALSAATAAPMTWAAGAAATRVPIVDTHIHLFDGTRPQGAPYQGPREFTTHVSLPQEYRKLAVPQGIVGAIAVEASPWIEDNLWLLEAAQTDSIMVGVVGCLQPEKPEFGEYLDRYHKNPLYRGIRVNDRPPGHITQLAASSAFIDGLKLLAQADLVLDTANPSVELLQAVVRISDQVPDLRIVVDHLPVLDPTANQSAGYAAALDLIRQRPSIFVKLSEILHRVNGEVATDMKAHSARLDYLLDVFGDDRIMFGSDYPNSVGTATFEQIVALVRRYFASKPEAVAAKYFWSNSTRCYKWIKRSTDQAALWGAPGR